MRLSPAVSLLAALFPIFLLFRVPFWPSLPLTPEAAGFALAFTEYSPLDGAPDRPDGFWYALCLRVVGLFIPDPIRALHWTGALLGLAGLWFVYRTGRLLGSRASGLAGAVLFLFHPVLLHAGVLGGRNQAVAAFSALLGFLAFRYVRDRRGFHFDRLSFAAGLAGGLSFEAAALFLPLWGFLVLFRPPEDRGRKLSILLYLFASTLWMVPAVYACGGVLEWLALFRPAEGPAAGPLSERLLLFGFAFGLPLTVVALTTLRAGRVVRKGDGRFLTAWVLPGFVWYLASGASAVLALSFMIPPVLILFSLAVSHLGREDGKKEIRLAGLSLLCAVPGVTAFLLGAAGPGHGPLHPLRLTVSEIRKVEQRERDMAQAVRSQGAPFDDAILVFTPCARWKPAFALSLFPEAEIHEVALPARGGMVHRVFRHGRAYRTWEPEIDARDHRVLLFGVENAREFFAEGGLEAGPAASESDLFVLPAGRCNILNLSGCRVTVQP